MVNINKILKNTFFNDREIILIKSFSLGLKKIEFCYFYVTESGIQNLTIKSNDILYFFAKTKKEGRFFMLSMKNNVYTEFFVSDTDIKPYRHYINIKEKDGTTTKRKLFETLYTDDNVNIHVFYPKRTKNLNSMVFCIETEELKEDRNTKTKRLNTTVKYFEILKKKQNKTSSVNIRELKKYFNNSVLMIESHNISDVFKNYVNFSNVYDDPHSEEITKGYREFSLIFNMLDI